MNSQEVPLQCITMIPAMVFSLSCIFSYESYNLDNAHIAKLKQIVENYCKLYGRYIKLIAIFREVNDREVGLVECISALHGFGKDVDELE